MRYSRRGASINRRIGYILRAGNESLRDNIIRPLIRQRRTAINCLYRYTNVDRDNSAPFSVVTFVDSFVQVYDRVNRHRYRYGTKRTTPRVRRTIPQCSYRVVRRDARRERDRDFYYFTERTV